MRRTTSLRALLPLLVLAAGPATAASVRVEPAFGYRIGDSVIAIADLSVDRDARLDDRSLPKTGRVNGWLALQEVKVSRRPGGWEVVRVFQVTASATEPKMLFLPKAELKFKSGSRELSEQLESVPISVSPLSSSEPILRTGFGALRPDRDVPEPRAGEALQRARLLAAILAGLALLWVALRALARRRRGFAPFGVAAGRLRRLIRAKARIGSDPDGAHDVVRQAYRILHDAFNEAAGRAVFASQKESFLAAHPRFAPEAGDVRAFFERSEQAFFAVAAGRPATASLPPAAQGEDLAWLSGLARRLARLEQPGR